MQYETGLIFGSNGYRNNFIKNYFQSKGCSENLINSSPYSFYQYSCNNESQFSDFPDINLGFEGQYNFTLTKNDLFKKIGNNYFFLVVFQSTGMDVNYWRLGQLFFKKYPMFLFESIKGKNGEILYYTTNKEIEDDGGNVGLIVTLSIIIPLIVIAAIIFGIYYYRRRNKRNEELFNDEHETGKEKNYPIMDN